MNDYGLNGTVAALAPYSVRWRDIQIGTDGDGRAILAGYQEIDLEFESASIVFAREWLERASSGSLTLDVLDANRLSYRTLSGVFMNVTNYPQVESVVSGPFSVVVTRVPK